MTRSPIFVNSLTWSTVLLITGTMVFFFVKVLWRLFS